MSLINLDKRTSDQPITSRLKRTLHEAEGYLELGMSRHALAALQRNATIVGNSARGCYLLGDTLRELGRCREAIPHLVHSTRLDEANGAASADAWLALAWCQKRVGRVAAAIASLRRATDQHPHCALLHFNLACYRSLQGDRSGTLDSLAVALRIDRSLREFIPNESDFDTLRGDPGFFLLTHDYDL